MIYIFEGSYWRTLRLSQHTASPLKVHYCHWKLVCENSYAALCFTKLNKWVTATLYWKIVSVVAKDDPVTADKPPSVSVRTFTCPAELGLDCDVEYTTGPVVTQLSELKLRQLTPSVWILLDTPIPPVLSSDGWTLSGNIKRELNYGIILSFANAAQVIPPADSKCSPKLVW